MSQNPNQNAANNPDYPASQPAFPGSPTTATPAAGGLKSSLKVAVPLVALVGVVFGITYLGMYTPPKPETDKDKNNGPGGVSGEPPLRFFTSTRRWDPPKLSEPGYRYFPLLAPSRLAPPEGEPTAAFSLPDRIFQGFFEPSGPESPQRRTAFWFENRNDKSVTMQLKEVSCSACSGARLAAIPPETTRSLLQHTAIASLPLGAFNGFGVGLAQPAAALTQLQWTHYAFKDNPHATFHIPAAANADKWSPQWGILELTFQVRPGPPLRAYFAAQIDGTSEGRDYPFALAYEVAEGFELSRTTIDAATVTPLSGDSPYELIVYSSTRGPDSEFGDLLPPTCLVQPPPGVTEAAKFLDVTKVERIPDSELLDVAEKLTNRFAHVRSAYRVTFTLHPKVGEHRLDIGQLERTISVSVPGVAATKQATFKALVRGAVWVEGNPSTVEVPSFRGADGLKDYWVNLSSEKPGMELTVLKEECEFKNDRNPQNIDFVLEKQPDSGGMGHYKLWLKIPPGKVFGQFTGVVVLEVKGEAKGPALQRLRIPFKGGSRFN